MQQKKVKNKSNDVQKVKIREMAKNKKRKQQC
jgi:hypothetical protein